MSGAHEMIETGEDIEARAAEWLVARRVRDDWNTDKQAELDTWLEESPSRRVAYLRLEGAWNRSNRLRALHQPEPAERTVKIRLALLKSAAAVAMIAIIGVAASLYALQPRTETYATALGEHRVITLTDGSRIELNTDTVVRTLVSDGRRIAWLDHGEAFFQVRHDAAHPFVVLAGDRRVTDLGTQFVVRRDMNHFEVDVVEGRVQFDADNARTHAPAVLLPGDVAVADANSLSVRKKSNAVLAKELGWRRGVLIFDATPLAEAAAEFNRYNVGKIIIADAATARLSLGGTFRTSDDAAFIRLAQEVLGLRVRHYNNETVISR